MKEKKPLDLIERTFKTKFRKEGVLYLACNDRNAFFTSTYRRRYLLDYIYFTKLYKQIVGISLGTNCAPLVADLLLFCYERDFMTSLSGDNRAGIIEAFNSASRY